jgi:hypothetical protein
MTPQQKSHIESLISKNGALIEKTALSDCHCKGLYSFILNENPKIRLFIADNNCELYKEFDSTNPIIPIHSHKYDDYFIQLEGKLVHHIYEIGTDIKFNKYSYLRLSDDRTDIVKEDVTFLDYMGEFRDITFLDSKTLHTAHTEGERCSWIILESTPNKDFVQYTYHQNLILRNDLYTPLTNSIEFLKNYLIYI